MYSTSVYLLPTRVYGLVVRTSTTESMILVLVEPTQKNVATIASPRCGLVGLNPLMSSCPLMPIVAFDLLNVTPFGEYENEGTGRLRSGLTDSVQLTANSATATSNPARDATVAALSIVLPPVVRARRY